MTNPIDQATTKTVGALRAVKTRFRGLSGVFTTLAQQHGEVKHLLELAVRTSDPDKQRELWPKLRVELLSHERAEMLEVYSALERYPDLAEVVLKHRRDARDLEVSIDVLDTASYGSKEWATAMRTLQGLVTEHARMEEEEFFPRAAEVLEKEEAQALDDPFQQRKATIVAELGGAP